MNLLHGKLMSADRVIGTVKDGHLLDYDENLLPLYLKRTGNMEGWLAGRAIDTHRPNSRLLKKILRLRCTEDAEVALEVNGATITDHYWFYPEGSELTYEDVRFGYNDFDKVALYGDPNGFSQKPSKTPELTNLGSYEKCWRNLDGDWWLYKAGNRAEYISELFICRLGMAMGFSMAWYEMDGGYIRTENFVQRDVNFEAMDGIMGNNDDYNDCFDALMVVSEEVARAYLKIIWMDSLCYNMDRHMKNFGVLRDHKSGNIIGLAPNYDNNIALFSRGYVRDLSRKTDGLIKFFDEFVSKNEQARAMYKTMIVSREIPKATETMIDQALKETSCAMGGLSEEESAYILEFVLNGQKQMKKSIDMPDNIW